MDNAQRETMNVVLIGGGGHGQVIIDILQKAGQCDLLGIVDSSLSRGSRMMGYEVLGCEDDLAALHQQRVVQGAIIAVGDNWIRARVVRSLEARFPDLAFPNAIHPSAQIAGSVRLGRGNVVMAGVAINSGASVGDFCILNTNCSIDHDVRVGDFASFGPNSCAGGNVTLGEYAAVCLGANVIHGVTIGPHTVIGAGATVLHDMPPHVVAYGTPARKIRDRKAGDRYM